MAGIDNQDPIRSLSLDTVESTNRKIHINIAGPDGRIVIYYIPVDVPMHKILKKYCDYKGLVYLSIEFYYVRGNKGGRVHKRKTAAELHMVDGDQIDAFVYSVGA